MGGSAEDSVVGVKEVMEEVAGTMPPVRCEVWVLNTHRDMIGRGLAFGLYLIFDSGSSLGGLRPAPACTCRRLLRGGAFWGARAKHASRHACGLAFGLYLNCDAGILIGMQGEYRPLRAGVCCAALRRGAHAPNTHRDMVADW